MFAVFLLVLVVWLAVAIIGFAVKVALLGLAGIILFSVTGIAALVKLL